MAARQSEEEDAWKRAWDARENALRAKLGPPEGTVLHAMVPFFLGGQADVLPFREHLPGRFFATCELLGNEDQIPNDLGTYELLIAHRDDADWGGNLISRLARYTCEMKLESGDTMEIGPAVPEGSTIAGFLFCEYARFEFENAPAGLLLCLGITQVELDACRAGRRDVVFEALTVAGVYPYTDLFRSTAPGIFQA